MPGAALAACCCAVALGAAGRPTIRTAHGCYLVGARVHLRGSGFAPDRSYVVSIDGVYFGRARTDSAGAISPGTSLRPGGLPAGVAQAVDRLEASDGSRSARTTFTLTRRAGARFLASSGTAGSLRAPVEVWGFSLSGARRSVYLHYVEPSGGDRMTVALGRTHGQCGYLRTSPIKIFPFTPSRGNWTLQVDTRRRYSAARSGAVARIAVQIH